MTWLDQLNSAPEADALAQLNGLYEHSPWAAEQALAQRPFASLAQLKHAMAGVVREAPRAAQLALLRAHPELAGKAMVAGTLTPESAGEQTTSGLTHCSAEELATLMSLNTRYQQRFGWPFILAVRGPRGTGLTRSQIIATFERRCHAHPDDELAECLRQVHRIAELRLNDKAAVTPEQGHRVWDWAEALAQHSDAPSPTLTVTYLTPAHRACAAQLAAWMRDDCGFDEVHVDAVGNVVGRYRGSDPTRPRLLTGSHYDTVRNGGKYDGRLGILVPMACVRALHRAGRRLPFGIEVVGFAEEEGQRYRATFLGSSALVGQFDAAWLDQRDAEGVVMKEAMAEAGLDGTAIAALRRDPADYLAFVETHIEQGPVLDAQDLPLGIVTSINGSVRAVGEMVGRASHAGTTPMGRRRDAAAGVAELLLYVEQRAGDVPEVVGTVGQLNVPDGSMNVVPGRCRFSLDLRATTNAARDALASDVAAAAARIAERRGLQLTLTETLRASAAPCAADWQARWAGAVSSLGLPVFHLPSGAGHDAMKLHDLLPQAMLFLRGGNSGISHNPLETITSDDADLCVAAFAALLEQLA
ncbi:MAG: 2-oxo-4-hydroxy-4-carboxy-5-ureidoimidazoline decarboxylase [Pseudomonadota bacterium]|jgi:N-carbamoyl-L-amino-acid hydrolase